MAEPVGISSKGIKLGYSSAIPATTYTDLEGLLETPEIGGKTEKIDVTTLADKQKRSIPGTVDPGEPAYKFLFANGATTDAFRVLKGLETEGKLVGFQEEYPDGTKVAFTAFVQVTLDGAKVNDAIGFTLNLTVNSEYEWSNPSEI